MRKIKLYSAKQVSKMFSDKPTITKNYKGDISSKMDFSEKR